MTSRRFEISDQGSALILAILFLLATGLVIIALGDFAVQSASTNISVRSQAKVEVTAETAATAAIQQVRISWQYPQTLGSTMYASSLTSVPAAQACMPAGVSTAASVYCEGWQIGTSRLVDFFVCGSSYGAMSTSCLARTELFAAVTFQDIPDGGGPNSSSCTSSSNATCGIKMNIGEWDVRIADA